MSRHVDDLFEILHMIRNAYAYMGNRMFIHRVHTEVVARGVYSIMKSPYPMWIIQFDI